MDHPYLIVAAIMTAAGLLGGWLNYVESEKEDGAATGQEDRGKEKGEKQSEEERGKGTSILQSLLAGLVASFMVPLFLNMISSGLLDSIRGKESTGGDPMKLFVLAGFCLVAAVYSKTFISNLSARMLNQLKSTKQELKQVKAKVDPMAAKQTEQDIQDIGSRAMAKQFAGESKEQKVLQALTDPRFTFRTVSGICKDTEIEQDELTKILYSLAERGLVKRIELQARGETKIRWALTEQGRAQLPQGMETTG